jgi:hypothetical protein
MFSKLRLHDIREDIVCLCYSIIASLSHRYMFVLFFVNVPLQYHSVIFFSLAVAQMGIPSLTSLAALSRTSRGARPLLVSAL